MVSFICKPKIRAATSVAVLNPPSNVRVQASSDTSAIIDWNFDETNGVSDDGFVVKYIDEHITGSNSDTRNWEEHTVTTDPKARRLEIIGLNSNKPYSFCVVSVKDNRQSQCSSPVTINRLTTPRSSRISPKRKQVSEEYIETSRNEGYDRKEEESSFPWWILIPLILLPLLAILGYMLWKKRQTKTEKIVTHRRTSYTHAEGHHQEDDKQWEEKRLYIQQQRNANLELEKRNEELGLEIAKTRRARLEEEREALKLEQSRINDNQLHHHQQHDKQYVAYK
uniref:Fibronectin type-III domain-containing protein n=1 Tax=Panagrolaimus sp. PS1159 TaxID=55785 RepID=A0AC35EYY8_9BILA